MSALVALVGCLTAEPAAPPACTTCHGSGDSPAPPQALGGFTDFGYRGVGAHQDHLSPDFSRPVECYECHHVPEAIEDTGHLDSLWPAEITWEDGDLSARNNPEPFDGDALTCVVYCHGSTLTGGVGPLVWTETTGACNGCHGFPPPPPHPTSAACASCHDQSDVQLHVDGALQVFR